MNNIHFGMKIGKMNEIIKTPLFDKIKTHISKIEHQQIFLYVPYIKTRISR